MDISGFLTFLWESTEYITMLDFVKLFQDIGPENVMSIDHLFPTFYRPNNWSLSQQINKQINPYFK